MPYLQSASSGREVNIPSMFDENVIRFQPDDVLGITVNVLGEQAVASDFNLPLQPSANTDNSSESVSQGIGRQSFLVSKDGYIDFPNLGLINVVGFSQAELEQHFKLLLRDYLKVEPFVTVRLMNFKLTVLGEVGHPGQITVAKEHVNIFEALALAGDMTIYGRRDNVKITRKMPDGSMNIVTLDVNKAEIISDPYFYLHQNDIVYVVPTSARRQAAEVPPLLGVVASAGSFLMSLITFIIIQAQK
jgi:polysaccharide export outer membrane protein